MNSYYVEILIAQITQKAYLSWDTFSRKRDIPGRGPNTLGVPCGSSVWGTKCSRNTEEGLE